MTKILIVDEAEIFLKLERSFLLRAGFDLHVARDPEDLFQKAQRKRPDLVLLHSRGEGGRCGVPCALRLKADPSTAGIPLILIRPGGAGAGGPSLPCERILEEPVSRDPLLQAISSLAGVSHRVQPRVQASLAVAMRAGRWALRGQTKDLSSTGLFVQTRRPLRPGVPVRVEVTVPAPGGHSVVIAQGIVVRDVADDPSSYLVPGNAVHLEDLDDQGRRALESFIGLQEGAP
jgi:CheY-like chemotaxis protein